MAARENLGLSVLVAKSNLLTTLSNNQHMRPYRSAHGNTRCFFVDQTTYWSDPLAT